jgi:outer membrane protein assembly factor BamA
MKPGIIRLITVLLVLVVVPTSYAQEMHVADLKVQGNKKISTNFIKRISTTKGGQTLDSLRLENDIKRLKRLPAIAHAYFQVFPADKENEYNVFYNIEENLTIIPSASVYTSSNGDFAYRLGLYEFNMFKQNIAFGGFYQNDIYNSYGINLRAPYLFSSKLGMAINYQNLATQEPVFFNNTSANYKYNNKSFEVLGLYEFTFKHRIALGLNYFTEQYNYKFGATSPEIPLQLKVKKLLYKAGYTFDNLEYDYQYISGFKSILNVQYVLSRDNSQPTFSIVINDFLYFNRITKTTNWASRLRLGVATNKESPFAPFSVDNNLNIRGVGNIIDRGTAAIVLNTEFRKTVYEKNWFVLQGNAFIDAGTWRNPGGNFGDFEKEENIRIYPGLGLRFIHKRIFNAIFRIDYGYGITKNASTGLVFGIGQYF